MEKVAEYAATQGLSLYGALLEAENIGLSPRFVGLLTSFSGLIRDLHGMADYLTAGEITEEVLSRTGYRDELKREGTVEATTRLENIEEFLSVTQEFEVKSEDKALVTFLTELALVSDVDALEEDEKQKQSLL